MKKLGLTFFGTEDSLKGWKVIVEKTTGKKCEEIKTTIGRHNFFAPINEEDCRKLMEHWYEPSSIYNEHTKDFFPWNFCIAFTKNL